MSPPFCFFKIHRASPVTDIVFIMKKFTFIGFLLIVIAAYSIFSCKRANVAPEKEIAKTLIAQIDSFSASKNKLLIAVKSGTANEKQLQQLFLDLRISYKKIEWATEYFDPAGSRFVNGPPVQEIEMSNGQVFQPAGLQVIEAFLFPKYDSSQKKELIRQLTMLQTGCDKYKLHFTNIAILDWQVYDAAKLEMFRIFSLGITGFDNPLTLKSAQESEASIESLKVALAYYEDEQGAEYLPAEFNAAALYLKQHTNFNAFNRAEFITRYGNPITVNITTLEKRSNIHETTYNRLLNMDAKTMFEKGAFNPNAFNPNVFDSGQTPGVMAKRQALGRVLFADPILSGTSTRSCQSCHDPSKAFTDGLVKNTIINDSHRLVRRNTPTLINAALQPSQFYDLRANTLEDQALAVVQNRDEMHGSMKVAAQRLWQNKSYRELFSAAFPQKNRAGIDTLDVMSAIGTYVRSLVALNSRFDEYMQGNKTAMNQQELNGFNIFMGKGRCATCHYMPLFNGSFPPQYSIIESEVIGVPQNKQQTAIDTDMGRYNILKTPAFQHAFKITTVRNAARTAPYMHNGVFTTLEQVVDFYNKGGGAGLGYKVDNQTLASDKLNLTPNECNELVAFIKSLDSKPIN
jgi:cytochrome c peroxidase